MKETKYRLPPILTFYDGPHTSEWIRSSLLWLRFRLLGKGSRCCFSNYNASRRPFWPLNFNKPKKSCFNCMSWSLGKFIWLNRLCHKSISESTFYPSAYMAVSTSLVSRMNICPSLRPRVISRSSSSMKHPSQLNCAPIPWSTVCLNNTSFLVLQ